MVRSVQIQGVTLAMVLAIFLRIVQTKEKVITKVAEKVAEKVVDFRAPKVLFKKAGGKAAKVEKDFQKVSDSVKVEKGWEKVLEVLGRAGTKGPAGGAGMWGTKQMNVS